MGWWGAGCAGRGDEGDYCGWGERVMRVRLLPPQPAVRCAAAAAAAGDCDPSTPRWLPASCGFMHGMLTPMRHTLVLPAAGERFDLRSPYAGECLLL